MSTPPVPEFLDRWLRASACRAVWCPYPGGWLVRVVADIRRVEYFVVSPTAADLTRLADLASGQPDVWVTVLGVSPGEPPDRLKALTSAKQPTGSTFHNIDLKNSSMRFSCNKVSPVSTCS